MPTVVVTGIAALGPFGDLGGMWSLLVAGRTCVAPVTFEKPKLPSLTIAAARLGEIAWADHFPRGGRRNMNPESQAFYVAGRMASQQAGLAASEPPNFGVCAGTRYAGLEDYGQFYLDSLTWGPHRVSPIQGANSGFNAPASHTAIRMGFRGPNVTVSARDSAALQAIAHAADLVRTGRTEAMIAGGVELLSYLRVWTLERAGRRSADAPRPYDRFRAGSTAGEGAAAVVLETEEAARRRGARPLAYLLGSATSFGPTPRAAARACIVRALVASGQRSVEAIFGGASGDERGDAEEAWALADALGEEVQRIPACAVQGSAGHWAGAGGALQLVAAIRAMETGLVPATGGFVEPDPRIPRLGVSSTAIESRPRSALVCSVDLAGHAAAIVVRGAAA